MEMLKFLTQKFKAQSLNEVQPFQPREVEDRDSGTESDEENAELQAIEEAMQAQQKDQENLPQPVMSSVGGGGGVAEQSPFQTPPRSSASPVNSVTTKRPLQLVNPPNVPVQLTFGRQQTNLNTHRIVHVQQSPQVSSDFERCSLDYEPTSSAEFDHHSSEEELAVINCNNRDLHPEKRKWSQVNRCGSCNDTSGSSDEEIRDLLCAHQAKPLNFSSSPPKGVHKLSRTMSPKIFLANVSPATVRVCSVSPRKRHRLISAGDVGEATVIQRPCLDFEKMQMGWQEVQPGSRGLVGTAGCQPPVISKNLLRKHVSHGINKARIVKIRSFNGSARPPKCLYDPAVFSFRSISLSSAYSPLTPVEEPPCAF